MTRCRVFISKSVIVCKILNFSFSSEAFSIEDVKWYYSIHCVASVEKKKGLSFLTIIF
jgi:hypothetical protein